MYSTGYYCHTSCTVPVIIVTLHVQYRLLLSRFMYSTGYYCHASCTVPVIIVTFHVQYRLLLSRFMYSTGYYCHASCTVPVIIVTLHVQYRLLLSDFNVNLIFWTDFRKILRYQISPNSFSCSRVVPCGQTDRQTDGRTDGHDETNRRVSQFCECTKNHTLR